MICLLLATWSLVTLLEIQQHRSQQRHTQAQIEMAFRSVVPRGVLVDAEKQLRNQLAGLDSDTDYTGPVALLARIAPLLENDAGIQLRGLTYNQRQRDIRLNFQAQSFSAIEQLLARLLQAGLQTELVHSSADGKAQQARFRIRWDAS
jgi:type II secretory pathway component PulL